MASSWQSRFKVLAVSLTKTGDLLENVEVKPAVTVEADKHVYRSS